MIKRILILLTLVVMAVYAIAAAVLFSKKPEQEVCKGMSLAIKDSIDYGFTTEQQRKSVLKKKGLFPEGKNLKDINVRSIAKFLAHYPCIKNAECYITSGNKVNIEIYQRIPVIRVISDNGDNYYIDDEGKVMDYTDQAVHVAIATGFIDRKFAQKELYELGKYIRTIPFWKSQVEQIHVTPKNEIEIVPRVGDHILFLGKIDDYSEKFSKLQKFYKEALNEVGWNKYNRINVEFGNQIICTKKDK